MPSPSADFQIEDDDDFGDFAGSDANNHGDYDFTQTDTSPKVESPSAFSPTLPSKASLPKASSPAKGSALTTSRPPPVPISKHKRSASSIERELAHPTSPGQEVHGPGVHEGAHISSDGTHIEAEIEVDGKMVVVQVPKDELALHPDLVDE